MVKAGPDVPVGTYVALNNGAYSHDPRFVEAPAEYRPERWLPPAVAARRGTPQEVLDHRLLAGPFSAGARMCLAPGAASAHITRIHVWPPFNV